MGVVYRATQLALNRRVAVKAIVPALAGDLSFQERFQRESELAASIDHPNVIPVYEAGKSHGTLYLIMRWVEGTDLRRMLDDGGRLSPARALALLRPVASALAAAHRRGLVHRDVKPANVLIAQGDEEHVYLTDFGIAQRSGTPSGLTATGVVVGTLDYTAPERLQGGTATPASDVYAFGCMLFETLTGKIPFTAVDELSRINAHLNDPAPSARDAIAELPPALDAIIARAMAKDPADRFADASELGAALEGSLGAALEGSLGAALEGSLGAALEGSLGAAAAPPTPKPRRRRLAAALGLAAVIAVIAVVAVVALSGGGGHAGKPAPTTRALEAHTPIQLGGAVAAMSPDNAGSVWLSIPSKRELVKVSAVGTTRFPTSGRPTALVALFDAVEAIVDGKLVRFAGDGKPAGGPATPTTATMLAADRKDDIVFTADHAGHIGRPDTGATATLHATVNAASYGEGWLWLGTTDGKLERLHRDLTPGETFDDGTGPTAIAFDSGVWASQVGGEVTRLDPRKTSAGVNATITVTHGAALNGIAAIDDEQTTPFVWTISAATKTLYEISYDDHKVVARLRLPSAPVAVAATTPTTVWVATADNELIEVTAAAAASN
jgi:serine/threonine-protein kinase